MPHTLPLATPSGGFDHPSRVKLAASSPAAGQGEGESDL